MAGPLEGQDPQAPAPGSPESNLTWDGQRRCSAKSSQSGKRCGRAATPGTTVCASHGSRAPQVRRKAALRLIELVDPAVATMARIMSDPNAKNADRLRAAENVLDRAGLPRRIETSDTEVAKQLLTDRLLALAAQKQADDDHVIDAEVIHDSAEPTTEPTTETEDQP